MPKPAPTSTQPPPAPAAAAPTPKPKITLRAALTDGSAGYKKLWPFIRRYKTQFYASIAAGAGSAIFTALQIKAIAEVTKHSFGPQTPAVAAATTTAATAASAIPDHHTVGRAMIFCSLIPIVMITRCLCDYLENYFMTWVSLRVLHDLRVQLFRHVLSQSLDFFNGIKLGSLISRISNDTRSAQLAITAVTDDIVTQPLTLLAVIGTMLKLDWRFTLFSLSLFPLCVLPIAIFGRKIRTIGREDETSNAELMVILHESLAGVRLVKSLTRESYENDRFAASSEHMVTVGMKVRNAMGVVGPIIESMAGLGIWAAMVYVYLSHMPFWNFAACLTALTVLYTPVKKLSKVHVSIQKALGATTKIFELLDINPTICDVANPVTLGRSRGAVSFENLTFHYNPVRPPALRNVSLRIEPGKSYALVGASGAGKSTMFSLLLRFYDPTTGAIRIDGHDIREVSQKSLRENIGIVSQDTFLFHCSILDNIRYGRLDATDEEIYEAARLAYAHDFIMHQPQGYDTIIGDKGCLISGGQQQRLAIARALLKNAPILLLDEATSALDSESEHEIQAALERLATGRTVIAIAHRLSTILNSDQIVVMDKGEIKEVGRHDELLEKSGLYRRLYDLQFNRLDADGVSLPTGGIPALAT